MKKLVLLIVLVLFCFGFGGGPTTGIKNIPDHSLADQGNNVGRSVKNIIDQIDPNRKTTLVFAHVSGYLDEDTTYTFNTNETIPSNITLEVEPGAVIGGSATLTINGPFIGSVDSFASGFDVVFGTVSISNNFNYAPDTASDDDYIIAISSPYNDYVTGMNFYFKAITANTGACTLNVNSWGSKSIKILHDQDPGDNCIESGSIVFVVYDGTNFQMIGSCAN